MTNQNARFVFPLPLVVFPFTTHSSSRRCQQRARRGSILVSIVNSVIQSLNYLSSKYISNSQHQHNFYTPSTQQQRVIHQLFTQCKTYVNSCRRDDSPSSSMCDHDTIQYLSNRFIASCESTFMNTKQDTTSSFSQLHHYFLHNKTDDIIAPTYTIPQQFQYSSSKSTTAVPLIADKVALPTELKSVCMLSLLPSHIRSNYVPQSPTLFQASPESVSRRRPRAFASYKEYVKLLNRMKSVGMVNFTTNPRVINGCFGVPKSDGEIRLVIDAQPANDIFAPSPHIDLPNPSHIANIDTQHHHHEFYVSKCDLSNFYHHIALPAFMQPYFALPPVRKRDIGQLDDADGFIYPMCTTMPMGWSHAVYVAQHIHLNVLYSSRVIQPDDNILFARSLSLTRPLHFVYIDDFSCISPSLQHANVIHDNVIRAYRDAGFIVKDSKVTRPTSDPVEVLGVLIDGMNHSLSVRPSKLSALQRSTSFLLQLGACSGTTMSKYIGSWIWPCLIRRPSLSIFKQVYRFIAVAGHRTYRLWPSVVRELCLVSSLAPLLSVSLCIRDFQRIIATDACETGGGLVSVPFSHEFMNVHAPVLSAIDPHMRNELTAHDEDLHSRVSTAVHNYPWRTIAAYKWQYTSHINLLEMNALIVGIRWATTYPNALNSRVHTLVDSSTVLFASRKGRSSSILSSSLQRLAAHLFAFNVVLKTYWIQSHCNPADYPSRFQ